MKIKTGYKRTFPLNLKNIGVKKAVDFIYIEGIGYVADRNARKNISYVEIEECGYVKGKKIVIDGVKYICRILKCTEWDDCMDYADYDTVWHWDDAYSWVRSLEYERSKCSYRLLRGYTSSSQLVSNYPSKSSNALNGFRPVLEPI